MKRSITACVLLLSILFMAACKRSTRELFFNAQRFQNNEEYRKAIDVYNTLIKRNNHLQKAFFERGVCYLHLKEYHKAIADFNSIIKLRGYPIEYSMNENSQFFTPPEEAHYQVRNIQAIKNRGIAYYFLNEYDKAFSDLDNSVANKFELGSSLLWLGIIAQEMGKTEYSCQLLKRAKELNDPDADEFLRKFCGP